MQLRKLPLYTALVLMVVSCTKWELPEKVNLTYIEMVSIPGGTFQMGDTRNEGNDDDKPVHTVTVSGFKMGKYEITQKQYQTVIGNNPSYFTNCDDCPVEQVIWLEAVAFCSPAVIAFQSMVVFSALVTPMEGGTLFWYKLCA